jgi:hypothetical protein
VAECYRETWLAEDFSYESYFSVWWYCSVMAWSCSLDSLSCCLRLLMIRLYCSSFSLPSWPMAFPSLSTLLSSSSSLSLYFRISSSSLSLCLRTSSISLFTFVSVLRILSFCLCNSFCIVYSFLLISSSLSPLFFSNSANNFLSSPNSSLYFMDSSLARWYSNLSVSSWFCSSITLLVLRRREDISVVSSRSFWSEVVVVVVGICCCGKGFLVMIGLSRSSSESWSYMKPD